MPNRLRPNSHFGCTNCKIKKVKCDELYPACTRCARQRIVCQYKKPTFSLPAGGAAKLDGEAHSPDAETGMTAGAVPGTELDDAQLCDLELMYHYTMYTAPSLGARDDGRSVHLHGIIALASKNTYLMHALLAVAALHYVIHHKIPEQPQRQKYFDIHARHTALASRTSRDVVVANKPEDMHAIFAYKVLQTESAYATTQILNVNTDDPLKNVLDMWRQARECTTLVAASARVLATGPLWNLIRPDSEVETTARKFLARVYPAEILAMLSTRLMESSSASATMPYFYKHAVELLDSMLIYTEYNALATDWRTNGWCNLIKPEIMEAIINRDDEAMILVAYYMVALHHAKPLWWVGDTAEKVMRYIYEMLGDRYSQILAWPLTMITGASIAPVPRKTPTATSTMPLSTGSIDAFATDQYGMNESIMRARTYNAAGLSGRYSAHSSRSASSTASMAGGIMSAPSATLDAGPPLSYFPQIDGMGGMMM